MAKTKISEFSSTPANNTDIDSINIAEGCAPSGINDAIRELMAQLKDFQTGAQGDSFNGPIGTSTAAAGAFTTLSATGAITSTLATGSAPLVIASTTKVANLNVDLLDGADWASPAALGSTTPAAGSFTTLGASSTATLNTLVSSGATLTGGTINGMTIGATTASTGAFTTLSASSTVTLSGGTANGVAYLNGSKVVTSGSALTFDGTNLGVGGTASLGKINSIIAANTRASSAFGASSSITSGYFFVGQLSGTTTSDFFAYSDASTTQIGSEANKPVAFYTNNSEGMRLTSTGLGIGTSSPAALLHISAASAPRTLVQNSSASGSANGSYYDIKSDAAAGSVFYRAMRALDGSNNLRWAIGQYGAPEDTIAFYTGTSGTERMRLDSSGNLGLGVTPVAVNPSGYKTLNIGGAGFSLIGNGTDNHLTSNAYYDNNATAWKYALSTSAARYNVQSGSHIWHIAPSGTAGNAITFTQAMTLDASSNLSIGTTSNLLSASNRVTVSVNGTSSSALAFGVGGTRTAHIYTDTAELAIANANGASGFITLQTNGAERARIDSSGNLLVGQTSNSNFGKIAFTHTSVSSNGLVISDTRTSGGGAQVYFVYNGSNVGAIQTTSSATSYNTSSDYRLKENIQPMTGALAKVAALKPVTYKWNADGSDGEGFIAHELAEVVPQCVTGEKDAVDEEGNPKYQGIDTSFLVATLTAAIQELKAEFDAYKASHP